MGLMGEFVVVSLGAVRSVHTVHYKCRCGKQGHRRMVTRYHMRYCNQPLHHPAASTQRTSRSAGRRRPAGFACLLWRWKMIMMWPRYNL